MTCCQCDACQEKRSLFPQCVYDMARGIGRSKKTIMKHIGNMPENFINDLRALLSHLRRSPDAINMMTPRQRQVLQAHRLPLRRFTTHHPRELLSVKRRIDKSLIPLAQAIGWLLNDYPKLLQRYVSELEAH